MPDNGKTTTAHLTGQLLARCGRRPAVLGTAGNRLADGELRPATHTTLDAPALHRLLARHRELGGDSVALEASSHALDQERLAGLHVAVAVFTNLTRDHLDYHGDMQSYAAAKTRLFAQLDAGATAVVHADDPASERMAHVARERGAHVVTFSARSRADLWASRLELDSRGIRFSVEGMGISKDRVSLPLLGRFNVENALAALAAVLLSGASPSDALEGLALASAAPGRPAQLEEAMEHELSSLNMDGARFKVDFQQRPDLEGVPTPDIDRIESFELAGLVPGKLGPHGDPGYAQWCESGCNPLQAQLERADVTQGHGPVKQLALRSDP